MKKFFALLMTVAVISAFMSVSAYTPTDGDFQNTWGLSGAEVENATSAGVQLKWIKADGADWPARLSYATPVKLDGLTIKLTNVSIDQTNGSLAVGFFGDVGQWVDSKGIALLHMNASTYGDTTFANGYILSKTGADMADKKDRFLEATGLNKKIKGDITISIKKNSDGSWNYVFNGQTFVISGSAIKDNVPDVDNCYLSFGTWTQCDLSFTVAQITDANGNNTTASTAATTKKGTSKTTAGTTVKGDTTNSAVTEASTGDSSVVSDADSSAVVSDTQTTDTGTTATEVAANTESSSPNIVLPIIIVVVLLAGCGVGVFFILKMKKKAN